MSKQQDNPVRIEVSADLCFDAAGVKVPWLWTVAGYQREQKAVPDGLISAAVRALGLQPVALIVGASGTEEAYHPADLHKLQRFLVEQAGAELKGHSEAVN